MKGREEPRTHKYMATTSDGN